ncbi:cilia- and flagella-associated protein 418-like [Clavelina lepadiformis]|uniref:Cilia- and flagella-associated protein 418 n=1 Tax=Clavelina lepadiformis TaxID=159417 RepID=A0ABP0FX14_CLALP
MDDLDDLLDEIEKDFQENAKNTRSKKSKRTKVVDDDIDDILNDDDVITKSRAPQTTPEAKPTAPPSVKCSVVYLGGGESSPGRATMTCKRACDRLRCTSCDFRVEQFNDYEWRSSVDYLFLRNNMPDFKKLLPKLSPKQGSRAYACQCSWTSVRSFTSLQKFNLKWVCGKH